jgi:peptidoglycan hydrolase-like protein with peptidoglycan-binding domain
LQHGLKLLGYYKDSIDGKFGKNTLSALKAFQRDHGLEADGKCGSATKAKFKSLYQYKTGGLADFTGPAWLDGTKSKPEYILNSDQTKAFFNLVDVLTSFKNGFASKDSSQNSGDSIYDIDINVESIESDYSVE